MSQRKKIELTRLQGIIAVARMAEAKRRKRFIRFRRYAGFRYLLLVSVLLRIFGT